MITFKKKFKRVKLASFRKSSYKKNKKKFPITLFFFLFIFIVFIPIVAALVWFNINILKELPPISKIENISFSQASVIKDRNGVELYKIFEENRKYVWYEKISKNMINAIIAVEDKNFWTNPWVDINWIIRAWIHDVTNLWWSAHGGSTLTQQIIKDFLLSRDKTIKRKLKEIVLAMQLNDYIKNSLKSKYPNLSSTDLDRKVKEKIIEMYLNHIFLGNNAYWIEAASQTYFGTSAQNLDVLQSCILAWIPQSPTLYNPYTKKDTVMGKIIIKDLQGAEVPLTWWIKDKAIKEITTKINDSTFSFNKETNAFLKYLAGLLDFDFTYNEQNYHLTYQTWRKDVWIGRMFEDWYIDQDTMKKVFISGLDYKFNKVKIDIKAPHFVFRVMDELQNKYGEDLLKKWWLTITTSLDYNMQKLAESSIKKNMDYIIARWGNNSSMIYLDSKNGDILAYVGSANYENETIDGKVDMVQAERQPWSSIKPFVYALAILKNWFTIDTPVFDIPFKIWENKPNNADGKFLGMMSLKKALAYSRNIPAIKMYFAAWQEDAVKDFLEELGITTLSRKINYGYPLAIWAWEVKMIELATAFSNLSALWQPAAVDPILEIRGPDWSLIYKKSSKIEKQRIPSWVAYMIWKTLSDKSNFPPGWVPTYNYEWFPVATKSGTTDLKLKNWKQLPRDGWMVAYTPSKVAIYWAWNTKWEPMNVEAYWWWLNADAWKTFFGTMQKAGYIKKEDMEEKDIKTVAISKLSWKLATNTTPVWLIVNTIWRLENLPNETDDTATKIEIDWLCDGKLSSSTPDNRIKEAYVIKPYSITERDIADVRNRWVSWWLTSYGEVIGKQLYLDKGPQNECDRRWESSVNSWSNNSDIKLTVFNPKNNATVSRSFSVWYSAKSSQTIKKVEIYVNNTLANTFAYNATDISEVKTVEVPKNIDIWRANVTFKAIDKNWEYSTKTLSINIVDKETNPPYLVKEWVKVTKKDDWTYHIWLVFKDDESSVKWWIIYQDWATITKFNWNVVEFDIKSLAWVSYEIYDSFDNIGKGNVTLKE